MTTLIEIPSTKVFHIPAPGSDPLPLSEGTLTLSQIPANPPSHPSQTIALSVGSSSFPVLPNTPVQKVAAQGEHPSYVFNPAAADGSAGIGRVKITFKSSQADWESTEALARTFEAHLKTNGVWAEKTLFVDDEWETAPTGPSKGWGEAIASNVVWAGQALAERLGAHTERHVDTTNPRLPEQPSAETASRAKSLNESTSTLAEHASVGAQQIGAGIHDVGVKIGQSLPDSIARVAEPVPEGQKTDLRKMAESNWQQITMAAKGVAQAATTVAGAVSENAHKAIEHNFGKESDKVAQDLGQSGTNLGSTVLSAGEATSAIVQGANATSGIASSKSAV